MGYAVVRGPSSGSGVRRRYQPDLVAAKNGVVVVVEVKRGREGRRLYIPARQVEGLEEFARRAGGVAVVAVKLPRQGWRIHFLRDLPRTPGGSARVDRPEAGLRLHVFDELLFPKARRITEFVELEGDDS